LSRLRVWRLVSFGETLFVIDQTAVECAVIRGAHLQVAIERFPLFDVMQIFAFAEISELVWLWCSNESDSGNSPPPL
jgi:hypothetical protein